MFRVERDENENMPIAYVTKKEGNVLVFWCFGVLVWEEVGGGERRRRLNGMARDGTQSKPSFRFGPTAVPTVFC
jgi:hypothetical protein